MRAFVLALFVLCVVSCHTVSPRTPSLSFFDFQPPEDVNAVLHNPDMGWVLYENYPLDQNPQGSSSLLTLPKEDFPAVDEVAIMFAWSDVETRDGVFDFSKVDFTYDYWRARGKKVQLRMSSESLLWWNNNSPPSGVGIPAHVLDQISAEHKQVRHVEGIPYTVVDARNGVYLRQLTLFLDAVAKHFDESRPVRVVDLRGFGVWGEWHSGFKYESADARHEALRGVIDRWSAAFPRHWLSLSASYDPDGPKEYFEGPTDRFDPAFTKHFDEFVHYSAFDYAMTKPNVTFRRDGVGGAVHSNERKLVDDAFRTLEKGPIVVEFLGGYDATKRAGDQWLRFMIDDALSLHPNYVNLLGYTGGDGTTFIRERRDLFDYGLRNMGYRLVPTRVKIRRGDEITIDMTWVNRGVGRAIFDAAMTVKLGDVPMDVGVIPTSKWIKGSEYNVRKTLRLPKLSRGEVRISLRDPRTGEAVALPLKDGNPLDGYRIGEIR